MGSFVAAGWEEGKGDETLVVGCRGVWWVKLHFGLAWNKGRMKGMIGDQAPIITLSQIFPPMNEAPSTLHTNTHVFFYFV